MRYKVKSNIMLRSQIGLRLWKIWTQVEINSAWETIPENIKSSAKENLGYYDFRKHKPWFDEGCSKLLDERKQAKLQWLQDPSEINGYNLNNVKGESSRLFRNKKLQNIKYRILELATCIEE
jgi:hypothetical protein